MGTMRRRAIANMNITKPTTGPAAARMNTIMSMRNAAVDTIIIMSMRNAAAGTIITMSMRNAAADTITTMSMRNAAAAAITTMNMMNVIADMSVTDIRGILARTGITARNTGAEMQRSGCTSLRIWAAPTARRRWSSASPLWTA